MMRVLWITYTVFDPFFPFAKGSPFRSSSWTAPLFYSLYKQQNIELGSIAPVLNGEYQKEEIQDIVYYSLPINSGDNETHLNNDLINSYQKAIYDFKPDVIHVHGVEKNFGLIRKYIDPDIPIVCSIQGLINPYYLFLKHSVSTLNLKKHMSLKNWLGRGGVKGTFRNWRKYMDIEKEILKINQYFIGRTHWDKSQVAAFNSSAHYFHGEELLRPAFFTREWNIDKCIRHRIFISSAAYPIKGFHILLHAAAILKMKYPDIQIVAPLSSFNLNSSKINEYLKAEDYGNYLKNEIIRLDLKPNVVLLHNLTAEEMIDEFCKANAFVLASFAENSPNALGEAMLIGTPSVVSPVGGVLSIVKDEESALVFPAGDYAMLAHQIDRVFENDELAIKLSVNAKSVALRRHDVEKTTEQYMSLYKDVIQLHKQMRNKANGDS